MTVGAAYVSMTDDPTRMSAHAKKEIALLRRRRSGSASTTSIAVTTSQAFSSTSTSLPAACVDPVSRALRPAARDGDGPRLGHVEFLAR